MRWRALLIVSACVNVALLAAWLSARRSASAPAPAIASTNSSPNVRTHVVVRRQLFTWSEVESDDYATYIANLRDIGCPEQTIRDIIIADVNTLYTNRRNALSLPSDPALAYAALKKLDEERRTLLTALLGAGWEPVAPKPVPQTRAIAASFGGAALSSLPEDLKKAAQKIFYDSQQRLEALKARAEQEGRAPSAQELADNDNKTKAELAKILTPTQLEEFLLRNSHSAAELRSELASLRYFNTTAEEYRALFRIGESFDQKIAVLSENTDPNSTRVRKSLEEQRERAIKEALGAERYNLFTRLHDADYQTAYSQARDAGQPTAAGTVYAVNQATQEEMNRLRASTNLSDTQLAIAQKRIELEQLKAIAEAYGQQLPTDPNTPQPPAPPQARSHVIRAGDTFGSLAAAYGVPVNAILDSNPGLQLNSLKPGQRIVIPPLETHGQ